MIYNPREEQDNLGNMVCFHSRYNLGDNHSMSIYEAKRLEHSKDTVSLPVCMYEHSGITVNTTGYSCPWDSGQVGFIYVTKQAIRDEFGYKNITKKRIAKIKEYLKNEVSEYDDYLNQ